LDQTICTTCGLPHAVDKCHFDKFGYFFVFLRRNNVPGNANINDGILESLVRDDIFIRYGGWTLEGVDETEKWLCGVTKVPKKNVVEVVELGSNDFLLVKRLDTVDDVINRLCEVMDMKMLFEYGERDKFISDLVFFRKDIRKIEQVVDENFEKCMEEIDPEWMVGNQHENLYHHERREHQEDMDIEKPKQG